MVIAIFFLYSFSQGFSYASNSKNIFYTGNSHEVLRSFQVIVSTPIAYFLKIKMAVTSCIIRNTCLGSFIGRFQPVRTHTLFQKIQHTFLPLFDTKILADNIKNRQKYLLTWGNFKLYPSLLGPMVLLIENETYMQFQYSVFHRWQPFYNLATIQQLPTAFKPAREQLVRRKMYQ